MAGVVEGLEMMVQGMGLSPEGAEGVVGVASVGAVAAEGAEAALQADSKGEEAGGAVLVVAGLVAEAAVDDTRKSH